MHSHIPGNARSNVTLNELWNDSHVHLKMRKERLFLGRSKVRASQEAGFKKGKFGFDCFPKKRKRKRREQGRQRRCWFLLFACSLNSIRSVFLSVIQLSSPPLSLPRLLQFLPFIFQITPMTEKNARDSFFLHCQLHHTA